MEQYKNKSNEEYLNYGIQIKSIINELADKGNLKRGAVLVIGCSTSEITGVNIGKNSVLEIGSIIVNAVLEICGEYGFKPAFQCCEHLNRALVVSRETIETLNLTQVNVKPQIHAGGGVAVAAYNSLPNVCMAMNIQADAAIDIGDTIIGMHMRPVAVPVRPTIKKIGQANVVMAYARLPYIGGPRAVYPNN